MKKTHSVLMSLILEISENSYFRWKKKDHVVLINLIELYFTQDDLSEYLNTGKIERFEDMKNFDNEAKKIADKFFFESYSRKPQNQDFLNVVFPEFEIYLSTHIKEKIEKTKKYYEQNNDPKLQNWIQQQDIKRYFNKTELINFIVQELQENEDTDKTSYILALTEFTDFEIRLLISVYRQFKSVE